MKQLGYDGAVDNVIRLIKLQDTMVVATCSNNRVTARTVFTISNGMKIYFITSKAYTKYKQILKNNNVALCFDNVQIEGKAKLLDHPLLAENIDILDKYSPANDNLMKYARYKNAVLIEVTVTFVELWIDKAREYIDIEKRIAYRV